MNLKVWRGGNTIFIKLPFEARRTIEHGCDCPYCKSHPSELPRWDTIAIGKNQDNGFAGIVHYPEMQD